MSSGTPAGGIADGRDGASVPSRRSATPRVPRPGPAARSLLDEHRLKEVVLKSERPGHLASTVRAMALRERGPSAFCMAKGSAAAVLLHWLLGQQVNRDSTGVQRTSKIVDGGSTPDLPAQAKVWHPGVDYWFGKTTHFE